MDDDRRSDTPYPIPNPIQEEQFVSPPPDGGDPHEEQEGRQPKEEREESPLYNTPQQGWAQNDPFLGDQNMATPPPFLTSEELEYITANEQETIPTNFGQLQIDTIGLTDSTPLVSPPMASPRSAFRGRTGTESSVGSLQEAEQTVYEKRDELQLDAGGTLFEAEEVEHTTFERFRRERSKYKRERNSTRLLDDGSIRNSTEAKTVDKKKGHALEQEREEESTYSRDQESSGTRVRSSKYSKNTYYRE